MEWVAQMHQPHHRHLISMTVRLAKYLCAVQHEIFIVSWFISDPPTYEEATMGGGAAGATGASTNHKPKYPMFRRQTSYSLSVDQS